MSRRELLSVCQAYAQSHGNTVFSPTAKPFVWRLRLRVEKAQSPHYWHMSGKNLISVNQYKYLGAVLDTELPDDKDIQRQLR